MRLEASTWGEIAAYLCRSQAIVIPVGSTEQHGPTGLCGTDFICPDLIAQKAEERRELLVAPVLAYGMSQHHLAFPGTVTLSPSTYIAVIKDLCLSLARHGFRQIFILNGHGGNTASLQAAISEIYFEASIAGTSAKFAVMARNWWQLEGIGQEIEKLYGGLEGYHATPSEFAVAAMRYPALLDKTDKAGTEPAVTGPVRDAMDFRDRFPDGRVGSAPAAARAVHGRLLVDRAADALLAELDRFATLDSGSI